ncbi:MAG TPA: hypothetical protein PKH09_08920 [Parvularculaceae bacterium]|nr:hypothetical protein [Parvularculaceae bacterium]
MRVLSPLAEIDFVIGKLSREGDTLVIRGDPASSIEAEVRMTPRDAAHLFSSIIFNPTAILYFLSLPFLIGRRKESKSATPTNEFQRLNKPW